jgi:hypothetical protein
MREMRGGCLCGQVRYVATAEPALVAVCHCKNCQKQAGTAFTVVVGWGLKTFNDTGDSGQPVRRNFCPECGSPITSDVAISTIQAGSTLRCISIATARSAGCVYRRPFRNLEKCLHSSSGWGMLGCE